MPKENTEGENEAADPAAPFPNGNDMREESL